ncbi:hypothetical protein F0562_002004 [Nyssa sinensis]|uniref:Uncharacterized protein n=1 Tax=Nyssa sinensis TaxID=561372 RepID=A0A5J5C8J9_9ASTE|nr:hypothetical protein F0562_002004 [Nyssa sinensis]
MSLGRQDGGRENLGYPRADQKSYLRSKGQKYMKYGETTSLLRYFQQQLDLSRGEEQITSAVQLDNEEQITYTVWADVRMQIDYGEFGDVVTFDTIYKTNEAYRPCESFERPFEAFLEAMSQKSLKQYSLIKIQPLQKHVLRNAVKHLRNLLKDWMGLIQDLSSFMYDYNNEAKFLDAWDAMLLKYNVQSNSWLQVRITARAAESDKEFNYVAKVPIDLMKKVEELCGKQLKEGPSLFLGAKERVEQIDSMEILNGIGAKGIKMRDHGNKSRK